MCLWGMMRLLAKAWGVDMYDNTPNLSDKALPWCMIALVVLMIPLVFSFTFLIIADVLNKCSF